MDKQFFAIKCKGMICTAKPAELSVTQEQLDTVVKDEEVVLGLKFCYNSSTKS